MSGRERILQAIKAGLRDLPGPPVISRSLRKAASVGEMPSVTLIDLGDDVDDRSIGPVVTRTAHVGLSVTYHGTSEEKAPEELASFEDEIRRTMLGEELRQAIGTDLSACLYETKVSGLSYPRETSGRIVRREIYFDVMYAHDVRTY
ncbi:MAG: hypothetical protein V1792_12840 [Pseudomonadota bacterium]